MRERPFLHLHEVYQKAQCNTIQNIKKTENLNLNIYVFSFQMNVFNYA